MDRPVGFDSQTEVLSTVGWRYIESLTDEWIAQYSIGTSEIQFSPPAEPPSSTRYTGLMSSIVGSGVSLLVTPDHLLPLKRRGLPSVFPASACKRHLKLPSAGTMNDGILDPNITIPKARLVAAWQADGTVLNASNTPKRGDLLRNHHFGWKIKKERKKNRLRILLADCGVTWSERSYPSCKEWTVFCVRRQELLWLYNYVSDDSFSWKITNWPLLVRQTFLKELGYWDGDFPGKTNIRFFTSDLASANLVSAVAVISGFSSVLSLRPAREQRPGNLPEYVFSTIPNLSWRERRRDSTLVSYNGFIHRCKMKSGFVVVRRYGKCCVAAC